MQLKVTAIASAATVSNEIIALLHLGFTFVPTFINENSSEGSVSLLNHKCCTLVSYGCETYPLMRFFLRRMLAED